MRRLLISFVATFAVALPSLRPRRARRLAARRLRGRGRRCRPRRRPTRRPTSASARCRPPSSAAPKRADGWTLLAGAYLQKVRETGDAGFYARAQGAVDRALSLRPADPGALTERSALELSRHDFRAGLRDALRARALAPTVIAPFGAVVDALVELGRYPQAERALQEMVDRKPNLAAYARVSYFRELHGDLAGALAAMRAAVSAGGAVPEQDAYVRSLLGGLELQHGRIDAAVRQYREALEADAAATRRPRPALAQADVARGRLVPGHRAPAARRRPPAAAELRHRAGRGAGRRGPARGRGADLRARAGGDDAPAARRRQRRRRAGPLRGRPRQPAACRGARPPSLGGGAERSLGRRPRVGPAPRRALARRARVGAARAGPRLARPGLPDPCRADRAQRGRARRGGPLAGAGTRRAAPRWAPACGRRCDEAPAAGLRRWRCSRWPRPPARIRWATSRSTI